jgi:hypothetical protein
VRMSSETQRASSGVTSVSCRRDAHLRLTALISECAQTVEWLIPQTVNQVSEGILWEARFPQNTKMVKGFFPTMDCNPLYI